MCFRVPSNVFHMKSNRRQNSDSRNQETQGFQKTQGPLGMLGICSVKEDKFVISAPSCLPDAASAVKRRADATEGGDTWS